MAAASEDTRIELRRAEDWAEVNELLEDFDDGVIKEVWIDGPFLDSRDWVACRPYVVSMIVHLQSSRIKTAKLTFRRVQRFALNNMGVVPAQATGTLGATWTVQFLNCEIVADECTVQAAGDRYLGDGPFLLILMPSSYSTASGGSRRKPASPGSGPDVLQPQDGDTYLFSEVGPQGLDHGSVSALLGTCGKHPDIELPLLGNLRLIA